jgi:Tol biopolymer transport system component
MRRVKSPGRNRWTALPDLSCGPSLSPDGKALAWGATLASDGQAQNQYALFEAKVDGASWKELTHPAGPWRPASFVGCPTFSPSSETIAYVREDSGGEGTQIWTMDANGAEQHPITELSSADSADAPSFSSDGTQIVFVLGLENATVLEVMASNGSDPTMLDPSGYAVATNDAAPRFSPNGQQIAYGCATGPTAGNVPSGICEMNVDGSQPHEILSGGDMPAFSPDGQQFAYNCGTKICVANADGSGGHAVANGSDPSWSR